VGGVAIESGLFTVQLDFGFDVAGDDQLWLWMRARTPSGSGSFEFIEPRQPLTAAPHSLGTRGIFVDDTGRVGIGTTAPASQLFIDASASNNVGLIVNAPGGSPGNVAIGSPGGSPGFQGFANNGNRRDIRFLDDGINLITSATAGIPSSINGLFIAENGNVGIGTTAPIGGLNIGNSREITFGTATGHRTISTPLGEGAPMVLTNHSGDANPTIRFRDANSGEDAVVINVAGQKLGIGTDPYYAFHVEAVGNEVLKYAGFIQAFEATGLSVSALSNTGSFSGIVGTSFSPGGAGVRGWGSAIGNAGVYGNTLAVNGVNYGVIGESPSTSGRGVMGKVTSTSGGVPIAVYGVCESASGYDFYADGAGVDYGGNSSIRWKHNVTPIPDPLEKIQQIRGVYFDWDEEHGGAHDVGMIAEEVGAVLPEIVRYESNGIDAMGMDYGKTTPLIVEAVKALRAEKDEQITALQDENVALRARLDAMETLVEQLAAERGATQ